MSTLPPDRPDTPADTPAETPTETPRALAQAIREIASCLKRLERIAAEMEREAEMKERTAEHFRRLWAAGFEVRALVGDGLSEAEAVRRTARRHAIPPETAAHYARKVAQGRDAEARARRDREIARLAATGRTNAEIAARIGCTGRSVSRAIVRARRAAAGVTPG